MTSFQLLPPLTDAEYDALRDDIKAHGILQPIDVDEHGVILDGHHRQQIAVELGISCPRRTIKGLHGDPSKRTYALTVNTNRRHLTQEQRRYLVENSLRLDPQMADRDHARRTGVSPSTVGVARERLAASGQVPRLDTRTDSLGRQQPAVRRDVSRLDTSEPPVTRQRQPVPLPVGSSRQALETTIRPESDPIRTVQGAIEQHLPPDPADGLRRVRADFLNALDACDRIVAFAPTDVAALDGDVIEQLAHTIDSLSRFHGRVLAARSGPASDSNVLFLRPKAAS